MVESTRTGSRQQNAQDFLRDQKDARKYINPELLCPLTQEVMRYPVVGPDGIAYEKDALEGYVRKQGHAPGSVVPVGRSWRGIVDKSYQEACRPYLPNPTRVAAQSSSSRVPAMPAPKVVAERPVPASYDLRWPPAPSASERYVAPAWVESQTYHGDRVANQPHGMGRLTYGPQQEFDGHFVAGIPHGEGTLRYADGTTVKAEWSRGALVDNSPVKVVYSTGGFYAGRLAGTLPHGQGRREWPCGDWFEGTWMLGNKHTGAGRSTVEGAVYKGGFLDGVAHGVGTCRWSDGRSYTGGWAHGRREGEGCYINGQHLHEGSWLGGHRHGQGTQKRGGHVVYEGGWSMNQRSGKGKLTELDGSRYEGTFLRDKRQGEGQQVYADGHVFTGQWRDDMRHGQGEFVWTHGDIVEGVWERDQLREGTGIRHGKAFRHKGAKPLAGLSFLRKENT